VCFDTPNFGYKTERAQEKKLEGEETAKWIIIDKKSQRDIF